MLLHLVVSKFLLCWLIHGALDLSKLGHLLIPLNGHTEVKPVNYRFLLLGLIDRFGHRCLCLHLLSLNLRLSLRLRSKKQ